MCDNLQTNAAGTPLDAYAGLHRGNELIRVDPDNHFYSALLHLPRVRYAYLDPSEERPALPLDFEYLGVTEPEFERLSDLAPAFTAHPREFDLAVTPAASTSPASPAPASTAPASTAPASTMDVPPNRHRDSGEG